MKILPVIQGTQEWVNARLGIPTCSQLDRIITPKQLKFSASSETYLDELLEEVLTGQPADGASGGFVDRGREMEDQAREWYGFRYDVDPIEIGFITADDGEFGGSPDFLVGEDGGGEIKCPSLRNHIGHLRNPESFRIAHRGQVQGNLYVSGRAWWDLISFSPVLTPLVIRCTPEPDYQEAIRRHLPVFLADLRSAREWLEGRRT